jgi:hypothetical protein
LSSESFLSFSSLTLSSHGIKICAQLYTALDRCRDEYIYRPNSNDPIIRAIEKVDEGNVSADIVQKARRVLKAKADHYRSWEQQRQRQKDGNEQEPIDGPESRHESEFLDISISTTSHLPTHDECENDERDDDEDEDDGSEEEEQMKEKTLSPSQMIRRARPRPSSSSSQTRQKGELLHGHHLGGNGTEDSDNQSPNQSTKGKRHPKGSFPSWVDLMVTAANNTPQKAGTADPIVLRYEPQVTHGDCYGRNEEKKDKVINPEILERRRSIQMLRKVDKMDWKAMLRDPVDLKLTRPKSAGVLNSAHSNKLTKGSRNRISRYSQGP